MGNLTHFGCGWGWEKVVVRGREAKGWWSSSRRDARFIKYVDCHVSEALTLGTRDATRPAANNISRDNQRST